MYCTYETIAQIKDKFNIRLSITLGVLATGVPTSVRVIIGIGIEIYQY
jgi:hypothetical protein